MVQIQVTRYDALIHKRHPAYAWGYQPRPARSKRISDQHLQLHARETAVVEEDATKIYQSRGQYSVATIGYNGVQDV
jgi:hypothetical protein